MSNSVGAKIEVRKMPLWHKRAGMFGIFINDTDSLFYSSNEAGAYRRLKTLLTQPPKGDVVVPPLKAHNLVMPDSDSPEVDSKPKLDTDGWRKKTTTQERIQAFMLRGKLGLPDKDKEDETDKDKEDETED